jgi:hypothetical protein
MGLHFRVVYRKGKDNVAADALSRVSHLMAIQGVSEATPLWMQEVLNSYTKYSHFIPLKHPFTAQVVAKAILDNVVKLHGCPKSIVSDRDIIFTSVFWKELFCPV